MEKRLTILSVIVIASLALNLFSFFRLGELRAKIDALESSSMSTLSILHSRLDSLSAQTSELQEAGQFLQKTDFIPLPEESSPSEIHLLAEFTFREIEKGAAVSFLYKEQGQAEWSVAAAKKEAGVYRAPLVLDPRKKYEYQLLVSGLTEKTTEAQPIPAKYYRPMPLLQTGKGSAGSGGEIRHLSATFSQLEPVYFDFFRVKEAFVKVYRDGKLDRIIRMEQKSDGEKTTYEFAIDIDKSISQLVAYVEYGDGSSYEKEIYPRDEYMQDADNVLKGY